MTKRLLTLSEALSRPSISIEDAGRLFFGLSRNGSYNAAQSGDIETFRIGKKIIVPIAPIAAKLGLRTTIGASAKVGKITEEERMDRLSAAS